MNYDLVSAEGFNQSQPGQGERQKRSLHKHSAPDGNSSQAVKLTVNQWDVSVETSQSTGHSIFKNQWQKVHVWARCWNGYIQLDAGGKLAWRKLGGEWACRFVLNRRRPPTSQDETRSSHPKEGLLLSRVETCDAENCTDYAADQSPRQTQTPQTSLTTNARIMLNKLNWKFAQRFELKVGK